MIKKSKSVLVLYMFLCTVFLSLSSIAVSAQGMMQLDREKLSKSKEDLQKMYMDYLTFEGYRPEIDNDGDIQFRIDGLLCFIAIDEKDPQFFRIFSPSVWDFENEDERKKVMSACDYVTGMTKVAKIFTVKKRVCISVELFVASPENFKPVFSRSLGVLQNAKRKFVEKIKE
jgi:hypothetical protein